MRIKGERMPVTYLIFTFCVFVLSLSLVHSSAFEIRECGDVYPPESASGAGNCGDDVVDLLDLVKEVEFALGETLPDSCQALRGDVPTGKPPNCTAPDGRINAIDVMVIIDVISNRQNCCEYYYSNMQECTVNEDCYDGLWCTGMESCENNHCVDGIPPCDDENECSINNCVEADTQSEHTPGTCSYECIVENPNNILCCDDPICRETPLCECEGDFDCDQDVDPDDLDVFLADFGRSQYDNPCTNDISCNGDFNCDGNVDQNDIFVLIADFGRQNCSACEVGDWCVYP